MSAELDMALALSLQDGYDREDVRIIDEAPSKGGLSLVDKHWELSDPNPNIHHLFVEYDSTFFWGKLAANGVAVDWSKKMTLCAGVCSYEGRAGFCSIRLSLPLLKLRPRRDLVETLLHEMIHAYLFVTHNNKDHDGHGPEFLSHMHRINKATGAKITVFHTFHQEVDQYRQHWWKCDGPCQDRPPYYGVVMRAMNRAPSPRDPWWTRHQSSCGGTYKKIKEPEGYGEKVRRGSKGNGGAKGKGNATGSGDIRELLGGGSRKESSKQDGKSKKAGGKQGGGGGSKKKGNVTGNGELLGGSRRESGEASKHTAQQDGADPEKMLENGGGAFQGRGFILGHRTGGSEETGSDARTKMLLAAERRKAEQEERRGKQPPVKRKKISGSSSSSSDGSSAKKPHLASTEPECIVISDEPGDDNYTPAATCKEGSAVSVDAPIQRQQKHVEDFKTCPVCGMGNIPSTIINIHVSLCLEADVLSQFVDDENL